MAIRSYMLIAASLVAYTATALAVSNTTSPNIYVPFYGTSANKFTSPARGWNSFGLQILDSTANNGFKLVQDDVQKQCDLLDASAGYIYCSLDSGWSGNGGDPFGRLVPDPSAFPDLKGLADHLHSQGKKLGVYILPGAFTADAQVKVEGMDISLGALFNRNDPAYNLRQNFDYTKDGVQQWHNSVINNFASMGVDLIKLDFLTPGSPQPGETLPSNSSGAAAAYHTAIQLSSRRMRLGLSWKLDRSEPSWSIWRNSADTLRLDQDLNAQDGTVQVQFATMQRAIEQYRQFIIEQLVPDRQGQPIMIRPDMDNIFVGDPQNISGLSVVQRYTQMAHWIGAGANLLTGSDMARVDKLGQMLLYDNEGLEAADFTAMLPMQPRNPRGSKTPGGSTAGQLQAWIAGPDETGVAYVVLANYGLDLGHGGFGGGVPGVQSVTATLTDLGIHPGTMHGAARWAVRRVWGGGGSGGPDHVDLGVTTVGVSATLGGGESALFKLTKSRY